MWKSWARSRRKTDSQIRRERWSRMKKKSPHGEQILLEQKNQLLLENFDGVMVEEENLSSIDIINGFRVRPGFYEINGASALPNGVNFTLISYHATSCELVLFHRKCQEPYARITLSVQLSGGKCFFHVCV